MTKYLTGDSLLFAAGVVAAAGHPDPLLLLTVVIAAAVLWDTITYRIGN